ncbi:MAG: glycosyltransferase family 4 protein [Gemmatimonadota bacterium]|nr:MAG: glycosyltransferase family 4 protein [Gemmatimonadota bacterium]
MGLRVLLQCLYYPPEVGGLESHVAGLGEGLARHGHYVDMLTSRSQPRLKAKERMAGVNVHRVWMPGKTPLGWMAHTLATLPLNRRLAREADILHAHTFASAVPSLSTVRRYRRPLVLTLHTSHFLMRASKPRWRRIFTRIIRSTDYLLATSEEILNVALEIYQHPRSEVMTNAVDTDRFAPRAGREAKGRRRIVVPRRLFPKNGVEYLVRAMPLIAAELDVEARIVGDGPERQKLTALAAELGVAERIEFLGARSNAEMPELLCDADLAVIPSLMEATSIAALEAMSCGLPVAASAVGGLPEIIDGGVGSLFKPADAEALAGAVIALLERHDLRALGQEGRRRVVENWSINRMVERHLEIYNGLLDERQTQAKQDKQIAAER